VGKIKVVVYIVTAAVTSCSPVIILNVNPGSRAYIFGHLVAGISGLNPAEGMDVCLLYLYVGLG
jgi:hypothetical protein